MIRINDYLDGILKDFKEYAKSDEKLCQLKELRFDGGKIPDYSDIHVQQLYLLRYTYAYAFEYKHMYRALCKRLADTNQISVTSVGCGTMIDYWSLTRAFPENCKIHYIGVDKIDWNYKLEGREQDTVTFIKDNFVDLISRCDKSIIGTDVYIFPKSLNEFTHEEIDQICHALCSRIACGTPVYFLFSLRTNETSLKMDTDLSKYLYETMQRFGFSSEDNPCPPQFFSDDKEIQKTKICETAEADHDFVHPGDVVDFLKNELPNCCKFYQENDCCNECKRELGRLPILTCSQVCYQIFEFLNKEA